MNDHASSSDCGKDPFAGVMGTGRGAETQPGAPSSRARWSGRELTTLELVRELHTTVEAAAGGPVDADRVLASFRTDTSGSIDARSLTLSRKSEQGASLEQRAWALVLEHQPREPVAALLVERWNRSGYELYVTDPGDDLPIITVERA